MSQTLPAQSDRRLRSPFGWQSLFAFLLLSMLLAFIVSFYHEVSYWYLASAQNHLVQGEITTALARADQAQRWTPQASMPWLVKAQVLLADHQLAPALEAAEAGLKLEPNSEDLRLYRVWIMLELKRERDMLSLLAPVAELTEYDVQERSVLAEGLLHRQHSELAIEVLLPIKGHSLETDAARKLYCRALRESKRYEEALVESLAAFEASQQVALHPLGFSDFFDEYLQNLLHLKRYDDLLEAIHQRELALVKARGELGIEEQNGFAYYRAIAQRELQTAESMAMQAVANTGARADSVLDTLAYVLYRRNKLSKSLELMDQTILMLESQPLDWDLITRRSNSYPSPLRVAIVQAAEKRKAAVYYYHRALIYLDLERADDARRDLEHVVKLGHTPGDDLF